MKSLLCLLVLVLLGAESHTTPTPAATTGAKSLRIAVVQMESRDHDIDGNLKRATTFAETAAARGATFVLFPEFMATGLLSLFRYLGLSRAFAR
jgi:hypothetical protein